MNHNFLCFVLLTLTQMLQLTEDFVTYEDGILNIKTSLRLSVEIHQKNAKWKLIYLFHTLWLALSSF